MIYSAVRGSRLYPLLLNALGSRVPDELVQLQSKPHRQFVRENPFDQRARLQSLPLPFRVVKYRRKKHRAYSLGELMLQSEVARKLIIAPRREDKLHLVLWAQGVEILHFEGIRFS